MYQRNQLGMSHSKTLQMIICAMVAYCAPSLLLSVQCTVTNTSVCSQRHKFINITNKCCRLYSGKHLHYPAVDMAHSEDDYHPVLVFMVDFKLYSVRIAGDDLRH